MRVAFQPRRGDRRPPRSGMTVAPSGLEGRGLGDGDGVRRECEVVHREGFPQFARAQDGRRYDVGRCSGSRRTTRKNTDLEARWTKSGPARKRIVNAKLNPIWRFVSNPKLETGALNATDSGVPFPLGNGSRTSRKPPTNPVPTSMLSWPSGAGRDRIGHSGFDVTRQDRGAVGDDQVGRRVENPRRDGEMECAGEAST